MPSESIQRAPQSNTPSISAPAASGISAQVPGSVKPKLGTNALVVFFSLAGISILALAFALLLIAKSGVISIPFFSRVYRAPQPTRLISAAPLTKEEFTRLITTRLLEQTRIGHQPPYIVKLTEEELTGAIQTAVTTALRDQSWKPEYTQMVVLPSGLQFFGRFVHQGTGGIRVDILIAFTAVMENGGVRFDPVSVQIGDYPIPLSLAQRVASFVFARDLGTFFLTFGDISLQRIRLLDGYLEMMSSSP